MGGVGARGIASLDERGVHYKGTDLSLRPRRVPRLAPERRARARGRPAPPPAWAQGQRQAQARRQLRPPRREPRARVLVRVPLPRWPGGPLVLAPRARARLRPRARPPRAPALDRPPWQREGPPPQWALVEPRPLARRRALLVVPRRPRARAGPRPLAQRQSRRLPWPLAPGLLAGPPPPPSRAPRPSLPSRALLGP